ncbi:MAG: hypothetical protein R3D53_09645 [Paracoccaceae bacterium]
MSTTSAALGAATKNPAVGDMRHKALAGEQPEHLAQGVAGNAEPRGGLMLGQLLARRELARDEQAMDVARDRFGAGGFCGQGRLMCHRRLG